MLYFALVRRQLERASVAWNSVTITDSNKLESIHRKFAAFCYIRVIQDVQYYYDTTNMLEKLNLQTLHIRRPHFDALFLIIVFIATNYPPPVLETVGIRVPTRNILIMFSCSFSHCSSARCVSAANIVCKCTGF
jgi:hypothetical protein